MRISPTQAGGLTIAPGGPAGQSAGVPPAPPGAPPVPPGAQPVPVPVPTPGTAQPAAPLPGAQPEEEPDSTAAAQPSSLLMAAPIAARSGSDIAVSLSLAPGGNVNTVTAEVVYDPLQLEAVGAAGASPGRLPIRINGSTAVRFRLLLAAGRAQVRVENATGIDQTGNTVPVATPDPVEIAVTQ
jgi:hypothetical protein